MTMWRSVRQQLRLRSMISRALQALAPASMYCYRINGVCRRLRPLLCTVTVSTGYAGAAPCTRFYVLLPYQRGMQALRPAPAQVGAAPCTPAGGHFISPEPP
jgi:hypothetical protein